MAYITNVKNNVTGTSIYIDDAIKQGILYYGVNDITQVNNSLPFVLDIDYYSQENHYQEAIYSQDDKNDLKIYFNDVELQDAGRYCEKITRIARIIPNDGSKRFSIDNFISTNVEVILHNVDLESIVDQVRIEIGTDVGNNTYQYIPLGVFNIQDTPTKDNNKITLKLRDNRVKFDFGYNAQTLIESLGGAATKKQIFNDICEKAGVETTIESFANEDDLIGIYDNTILGSTYISYLMEQAGLIPAIDRLGRLIAIDLTNLYVWRIPLSIIESYEKGEPYDIQRVVYESGIIKYETSSDETLDTLYLNAANPYISRTEQVQNIFNKLQNFEIDSILTKRVLGNPAIDPYDLIEVYNDLDGTNDIIFTTLANTTYTFNGVHRDTFDTQIGIEQRTENVSLNSEEAFKFNAKTNIDNINGQITLVVERTNANSSDIGNLTTLVDTQGNQIDTLGTRINQNVENITASVTAIQNELDNGVGLVKTTSVTIDDSGLNVSTNTSAIATLMTNERFVIRSGDKYLAYFGYDAETNSTKAEMDNLTVTNYLITGNHRIEKMTINGEKRTGHFFIG